MYFFSCSDLWQVRVTIKEKVSNVESKGLQIYTAIYLKNKIKHKYQ